MASQWSTSEQSALGVDLHLDLDLARGRRVAIEDALRRAIREGRLGAGAELPSTRALAADLGVARGTVTEAYDQLVAEGWLTARRGSGTTVAVTSTTIVEPPQPRRTAPRVTIRTDVSVPALGGAVSDTSVHEVTRRGQPSPPAAAEAAPRHDFRPGSPDVSAFPRQDWAAAVRRSLRTAPDASFRYGDPRGLEATREVLAGYLARARGVRTSADRIVVCGGFVQALALLASTFRGLGVTALAMEDPCMATYRSVTTAAGLSIRFLPVDADGADPAPLPPSRAGTVTGSRAGRRAGPGWGDVGALLLTPAHQYPTGTTLAPSRRAAVVEWARAGERYIVEDDYDGEFRYDRQPVGALQGMDPERVIYVGTASKSLAPALRLGWMALPAALVGPVTTAKELSDRQSGVIDQLALADLIGSGRLDRHIRRSRTRYHRRRDELLAALATVPGIQVRGIAAGLHAVVDLPLDGPDEANVVRGLAMRGVAVHGVGGYWHRPPAGPPGIVVGFGTPPGHAYPAAVRALADGLTELMDGR